MNLIYQILWTWVGSALLNSTLEKFNWFRLTGLIMLVLLTGQWIGLFLRKNHLSSFTMLELTLSSKLDWGSYITSTAKTASKKTGVLIRSMKFFFLDVALYLYKSTIWPCMEYCCHAWGGAPSCYLELLDKLPKRICRTIGPSFAASLESLVHRRNVARFSLFYT